MSVGEARRREGRAPGPSGFVSALGGAQICSWGSLYYAFPLIAERMEQETGWSRSELYGAATVGLLLAAIASFPIGRAIDRGHGRLTMTGGSALAGLLLLAWSQIVDLAGLYVVMAALGALQAATLYEPAFAVVARRLGAKRARKAIVTLTLWGGFASTVFIPVVQGLIDAYDWRTCLIALGIINLVVCAGLNGWAIRPTLDEARMVEPETRQPTAHLRQAASSPVFWTLALSFTVHAAAFTAFTFHFYPLLLERGLSVAEAVTAMAVIGPAQVAGRIGVTVLAAGASMRRIGSWAVLAFPAGFAILLFAPPSFPLVVAVAALYGAANGVMTIVRGAAVPEMLTEHGYGSIMGAMNTPATLARALAPLGAAILWTASGSYQPVLVAILAGTLILAAGFWSAAVLSRTTVEA